MYYLFDLDGTLIDSNGVWIDVDTAFLARRGMEYSKAYYEGVAHTIFPLAAQFTKEFCHLDESCESRNDKGLFRLYPRGEHRADDYHTLGDILQSDTARDQESLVGIAGAEADTGSDALRQIMDGDGGDKQQHLA